MPPKSERTYVVNVTGPKAYCHPALYLVREEKVEQSIKAGAPIFARQERSAQVAPPKFVPGKSRVLEAFRYGHPVAQLIRLCREIALR